MVHASRPLLLPQVACCEELLVGAADSEVEQLLGDQNNLGRTPLHTAATLNQPACVRWLLRKGAAVDACDKEG